jgi:hypothetical protein
LKETILKLWFGEKVNESQLSASDREIIQKKDTVSLIEKIKKKQPLILIRCKPLKNVPKPNIIWVMAMK